MWTCQLAWVMVNWDQSLGSDQTVMEFQEGKWNMYCKPELAFKMLAEETRSLEDRLRNKI